MPEQLTKYPDVTIQVLRSGGAKCGEGAVQEILTACPARNFCKLTGGEVCVYGLDQAPNMTQITKADWAGIARSLDLTPASGGSVPFWGATGAGGAGFLLGAGFALLLIRFRRKTSH
jgi:hypothetical protein